MGDVVDATEEAIGAAKHLTPQDSGVVAALRALARKIDAQDDYFEALLEDAESRNGKPPSVDNVSLPTYLKYSESLGLTPAGRERLTDKPVAGGTGRLGKLQAIAGGKG